MANVINHGKSIISIYDALVSAGVDPNKDLRCIETAEAICLFSSDDINGIDRIYQLVADSLDKDLLIDFKEQLEAAIKNYDGTEEQIPAFIIAAMMNGSSDEEILSDVAQLIEAQNDGKELTVPRMEDVWDNDNIHQDW